MPELSIVLSEDQKALIADLVDSGQFHDANEVLQEGLRLVEADLKLEAGKEQEMREAIDAGLRDLREGRSTTLGDRNQIARHIRGLGDRAQKQTESGAR